MEKVIIEDNGKVLIKQGDNYYKCTVKKVCDDSTFYIDRPSRQKECVKFEIGDIVALDYYTEYGTYYELEVKVLGKVLENGMLLYRLSKPFKSRKIQRRNFVRVILTEYTLYRVEEDKNDYDWEKAILLDLSGGGLKLKVKEEIKLGEKVKIKFQYKNEIFGLVAKVLRCDNAKNNGYICGLEFMDMDERKRDKIVEKVFEVMRRQREIM